MSTVSAEVLARHEPAVRKMHFYIGEDVRFLLVGETPHAVGGGFEVFEERLHVVSVTEEAVGVFDNEDRRREVENRLDRGSAYGVGQFKISRGGCLCSRVFLAWYNIL